MTISFTLHWWHLWLWLGVGVVVHEGLLIKRILNRKNNARMRRLPGSTRVIRMKARLFFWLTCGYPQTKPITWLGSRLLFTVLWPLAIAEEFVP